jgi:hypothetical protein
MILSIFELEGAIFSQATSSGGVEPAVVVKNGSELFPWFFYALQKSGLHGEEHSVFSFRA